MDVVFKKKSKYVSVMKAMFAHCAKLEMYKSHPYFYPEENPDNMSVLFHCTTSIY